MFINQLQPAPWQPLLCALGLGCRQTNSQEGVGPGEPGPGQLLGAPLLELGQQVLKMTECADEDPCAVP